MVQLFTPLGFSFLTFKMGRRILTIRELLRRESVVLYLTSSLWGVASEERKPSLPPGLPFSDCRGYHPSYRGGNGAAHSGSLCLNFLLVRQCLFLWSRFSQWFRSLCCWSCLMLAMAFICFQQPLRWVYLWTACYVRELGICSAACLPLSPSRDAWARHIGPKIGVGRGRPA